MSPLRLLALPLSFVLAVFAFGCSKEVIIGAVISESGSVETYGTHVRRGMDLAVEEINASGGVNGGPVTLLYKDDATNGNVGTQVTTELIEEYGVNAIIGAVSSTVTLAIAPICEKAGVVLLSPTASANSISDAGDWIWRNYPSDQIEGTAMAKFAKEEVGAETVVVFAEKSEWGRSLTDVFTAQYEGRFRRVEKRFDFDETMMDQLDTWVEETKTIGPDAVYVVAYDQELIPLLQKFESAGLESVRMSTSSVTADIVKLAGTSAENIVYPQVVLDLESKEPAVSQFITAYRAKYSEDPDIYSAHGYDAVKLMAAAITTAGSMHPRSIRQGLSGIENFDGAAGRTSFDSKGDVVRYPRIFIVRDGLPVPYDKIKDQGGSLFD
ncbi:MAG: ABC transporter substrate-binding protein [Acidobacteria bacterium]|nr:ABC transporter substrate-binding protein [Acidobacteriota bacterium]